MVNLELEKELLLRLKYEVHLHMRHCGCLMLLALHKTIDQQLDECKGRGLSS